MKFKNLQQTIFFAMLALISIVFVWLIKPYLQPIFWAVVLGIVFYPLQKVWLKLTRGHSGLSTLCTLLTIFALVLVPVYFIGQAIAVESIQLYATFSEKEQLSASEQFNSALRPLFALLEQFGFSEDQVISKITEVARTVGETVASSALQVGQNAVKFGIQMFVMLYTLFYILKHGPNLIETLLHYVPLGDKKEKRLLNKFAATARATLKGTLIIGIIQGVLGGILFAIVGIKGAVLWGTLMAIIGIIPAIGSGIIWGPAGVILLLSGQIWQGAVVLIVGTVLIGLVDNLLRPPLVGKDTEMPDVLVLLSTLGGLTLFGISGFVIGPMIAAFFLTMWNMFEEEYRDDLVTMG